MKFNHGPERLIAQMKSMHGEKDGFTINSKLRTDDTPLLVQFMPFKSFINETSGSVGLKRDGEFYFNFMSGGFTGIVCFKGSYLSLHTNPVTAEADFEIFLSDKILNNINLAEFLYRESIAFFQSRVIEQAYKSC
jgi:S-adenosylmethionine decarboxylase